jgi:O-antigen ligase
LTRAASFARPASEIALAGAVAVVGAWSLASAREPGLLLAGLVAAAAVVLVVRSPELGALLVVALMALFPKAELFERGLSVAGGSLKVTDLLIALTFASWLAAWTVSPRRYPLPSRGTSILLLSLLAAAVVGVVTAAAMDVPRKLSLAELRPLLAYLLVFPLVSGARTWQRFHVGIAALLVVAAISSVVSISDYVRGIGSATSFTGGAIRVPNVLYVLPLLAMVWVVALLALGRTTRIRAAGLALAGVAASALFFAFARGAWLALITAVLVVLVLLAPRRRAAALLSLALLMVAMGTAVVLVNAVSARGVENPLAAGAARLGSIFTYGDDISSSYRLAEWRTAASEISQHPLTGIGLGNSITFWSPEFSPERNAYGFRFSTSYIHNSYIWFALKLGLLGALIALALMARMCWLAVDTYRRTVDSTVQLIALASLGSLVALLVLALTGPHLNVDNATPVVAAVIAAIEITRRLAGQPHEAGA